MHIHGMAKMGDDRDDIGDDSRDDRAELAPK